MAGPIGDELVLGEAAEVAVRGRLRAGVTDVQGADFGTSRQTVSKAYRHIGVEISALFLGQGGDVEVKRPRRRHEGRWVHQEAGGTIESLRRARTAQAEQYQSTHQDTAVVVQVSLTPCFSVTSTIRSLGRPAPCERIAVTVSLPSAARRSASTASSTLCSSASRGAL